MNLSDLPGDLGGQHPLATWLNRLKRAVARRTPRSGVGFNLRESEAGVVFEILAGGGAGGGARVSCYRLKSVQAEYVTGRSWDGTTEGATDVRIAKPYKLRHSIASATIDGILINYSYALVTNPAARTATSALSGETENQIVTPRWLVNDLIWAIPAYTGVTYQSGGSTVAVTLLDLNIDGRAYMSA